MKEFYKHEMVTRSITFHVVYILLFGVATIHILSSFYFTAIKLLFTACGSLPAIAGAYNDTDPQNLKRLMKRNIEFHLINHKFEGTAPCSPTGELFEAFGVRFVEWVG